jgi:hypothetical protein
MDKFLDTFNQQKLNQEGKNHLNRSRISNEIEAVIKSPNKEEHSTQWLHCQILPDL